MINCPKAEECLYSEICYWESDPKTGKATPEYWCKYKTPADCPHFEETEDETEGEKE